MKVKNIIRTVDLHVAGEPLRFITGGLPPLRGETVMAKMEYMRNNYDHLRKAVMREPRGYRDMFGAVVTEPVTEEADCGAFYLDCSTYYPMCGTGTIALATMLVNTGRVVPAEPVTEVTVDTPGGQVKCELTVKGGEAVAGTFTNVPAFLYRQGVEITTATFGTFKVDIGFGGNFVAFVDVDEIGVELQQDRINEMIKPALEVIEEVRKRVDCRHPERDIDYIDSCMYCDRVDEDTARELLVIGRGQVGRSPSGTGTPARMAREYACGRLELGEEFNQQGMIGTQLQGRLVRETKVGELTAVVAEITGRAYLTGFHEFLIEEQDPLAEGYFII